MPSVLGIAHQREILQCKIAFCSTKQGGLHEKR